MRIRVAIVDDHHHAREGICEILRAEPEFEIVGVAESGADAVEMIEKWMPDLILMDIEMPGMDGLETTRFIKGRYPYVKIVMVTVSDDIAHLFESIKQGAQGYLLKNLSPGTWLEYLHAVALNEAPLSKEIANRMLREFSASKQGRRNDHPLTAREFEILGWVSMGLTNKEVALELDISEQTVKNHLKNILQKLHLENRVQLTRYAFEQGLLDHERR